MMILVSNFLLISSAARSWQELTQHKRGELYEGWRPSAEAGDKCACVEPGAVTVCSLTALITQLIAAMQIHPCEIVYLSQTYLFLLLFFWKGTSSAVSFRLRFLLSVDLCSPNVLSPLLISSGYSPK